MYCCLPNVYVYAVLMTVIFFAKYNNLCSVMKYRLIFVCKMLFQYPIKYYIVKLDLVSKRLGYI